MSNINYEIPEDLHRRLKVRAAERAMTLKALIIELLGIALMEDEWDGGTEEGT